MGKAERCGNSQGTGQDERDNGQPRLGQRESTGAALSPRPGSNAWDAHLRGHQRVDSSGHGWHTLDGAEYQ